MRACLSAFYTELATAYQLKYPFHQCINFLEVEATYNARAYNPKSGLGPKVFLSLANRRAYLLPTMSLFASAAQRAAQESASLLAESVAKKEGDGDRTPQELAELLGVMGAMILCVSCIACAVLEVDRWCVFPGPTGGI